MKKGLTINFTPALGMLIVDPIIKVKKSEYVMVADAVDDPHLGKCLLVGDPKPYENYPQIMKKTMVKVGDYVHYSIVGIEKIRMPYGNDPRHEFVVVPFERVLGVSNGGGVYEKNIM